MWAASTRTSTAQYVQLNIIYMGGGGTHSMYCICYIGGGGGYTQYVLVYIHDICVYGIYM